MALFKTHLHFAVVTSAIGAINLYHSNLLSSLETIGAVAIATIGGVLPDIDAKNSKPLKAVFEVVSVVLPLVILIFLPKNRSLVEMVFLWISFGLLTRAVLELIFKFTVHRGIFHSVIMAVVIFELGYIIFPYLFGEQKGAIFSFFLFFGYIGHLFLDEMVSVIFIKKSFGSALKLYDKNNKIGSLILYLLSVVLFWFEKIKIDFFYKAIKSFGLMEF